MTHLQVSTPIDATTAARELTHAWRTNDLGLIGRDVLALLLALWDLETGAGTSQRNNNFGNIIAVNEELHHYVGTDNGNTRRFRSYPSVSQGALAFVQQLTSNTRLEWRSGLMSGDPLQFVNALGGLNGGSKYFEAPVDRYKQTFLERWQKYLDVTVPLAEAEADRDSDGAPSSQPASRSSLLENSRLVFDLQVLLRRAGHRVRIDNKLGPKTFAATHAMQRKFGIPVTNYVRPETYTELLNAYKASLPSSER